MIIIREDTLRTLREVENELENTRRTMAQMVLQQSDLDSQLKHLAYRVSALMKEKTMIINENLQGDTLDI